MGISLIKEGKEAYPIRNQRNDEGRVSVTALFIQKNQCVKSALGVKFRFRKIWTGLGAALEDCWVTLSGQAGLDSTSADIWNQLNDTRQEDPMERKKTGCNTALVPKFHLFHRHHLAR